MKQQLSKEIITDEFIKDAIINNCHEGFIEDYLVLHSLLKIYKENISRFLEIGTHMGMGTKIIKNALGDSCVVYSMDLPPALSYISWNYPIANGKDNLSCMCDLPFVQLLSDSTKFDYTSIYPIDGWFIDGNHNYYNPLIESKAAIKSNAKLIIWHDTDINDVYRSIIDAFKDNIDYELFRVQYTRISYAVRKT